MVIYNQHVNLWRELKAILAYGLASRARNGQLRLVPYFPFRQ